MDVELQILKHLARDAHSTAPVIDEYCAEYKDLFKEVRSYECFKYLHLGIISSIKSIMTNIQGKVKKFLENLYGLRTWVEYGFRQCKQELGWTNYRFTSFKDIEKGWEIIFSVYTIVSLNSQPFLSLNQQKISQVEKKDNSVDFSVHQQWDCGSGWKKTLNNLRLILQPTLVLWLIFPWLEVFPNSKLLLGFNHLISLINQYQPFYSSG